MGDPSTRAQLQQIGGTVPPMLSLVELTRERPQADDIRRPPPEGVEQSGKATFTQEYEAQTARFRAITKDIKLEAQ